MATQTILWEDGSSDKITLTYSCSIGQSQMRIVSDPNNTSLQRKKVIKLNINGVTFANLMVTQIHGGRAYLIAYSVSYK